LCPSPHGYIKGGKITIKHDLFPSHQKYPLSDFFLNTPTVFLISGIVFLLYLNGIMHHAMWRDELQAWSLVRDSGSLAAIFHWHHGHLFILLIVCLWLAQYYPISKGKMKFP
jgi:hypothetical protein